MLRINSICLSRWKANEEFLNWNGPVLYVFSNVVIIRSTQAVATIYLCLPKMNLINFFQHSFGWLNQQKKNIWVFSPALLHQWSWSINNWYYGIAHSSMILLNNPDWCFKLKPFQFYIEWMKVVVYRSAICDVTSVFMRE